MLRLLLFLAIPLVLAPTAYGQTCSTEWAAPVDGDWDDQTKWTAGVPLNSAGQNTGGLDPCITVSGTYTVTLRPDDPQNPTLVTLRVGGASGTQTLVMGGYIRTTDVTVGARGRMDLIPRTLPGSFQGLDASGSVVVEGSLSMAYNGVFLTNQGSLEVAVGGTLRGTGAARLGGANGTFTVRGLVDLSDDARIDARTDVLGGTVRATSGRGDLFFGGGILRDATLDADAGAALVVGGSYDVGGTLSGSPLGEIYVSRSTLTAAASGATLNVTGTGLQFGFSSASQFQTLLTGGPVTNTGRLVLARSNFFSGISGTTLTNEGALVLEGGMTLAEDAVLRNRPSGIITMFGTQFFLNGSSVVRLVNEGLIVREDVGPNETMSRFLGVTLESLPGSEIRVLDDYLDFSAGPNDDALPPGMLLSGDGTLRMNGLPIRSTFSPGTEADPIGSLGPRSQDPFVLAPEAITILDIDAGSVSDAIDRGEGIGALMVLGGTLRVRARPGFTPAVGDVWTIADNLTRPIDGAFATIESEGVPAGIAFSVDTSQPGTAVLRAVSSVASEDTPGRPPTLTVGAPHPNPAQGLLTFRYGLPEAGPVSVRVLDALGRTVAVLWDGQQTAGWHTAEWTPAVASGTYLVDVRSEGAARTQRLTVLR